MFKKKITIFIIIGLLMVFSVASAGVILDDHKYAWSNNVGYINFENVIVNNGSLTGYAWSKNSGWINMSPATGGVRNNNRGNLSGYAWGEQLGWIDFDGVTIDGSTGRFSGTATGDIVGTITFDCPTYCDVETDWRQPSSGGGPIIYTCVYTYSEWSSCIDGTQTRTATADASPCSNVSDALTRSCSSGSESEDTSTATTTSGISISISPSLGRTYANEMIQFTVTISGTTTNNLADLSIIPVETNINNSYGTISNTGLYIAPNHPTDIIIRARARADMTKTADAHITVGMRASYDDPKPIAVIVGYDEEDDNDGEDEGGDIDDSSDNDNPTDDNTTVFTEDTDVNLLDDVSSSDSDNSNDDIVLGSTQVSEFFNDVATFLGTTTEKIFRETQALVDTPVGSAVTKTVSTAGVVGGVVAASSVAAINGTMLADLLFLPFRLWGLLLSALGLKKRNRPWGTVYDSVTKQPIDPAYVMLKNLATNEETMSITDLDGRYGFLVPPGRYALTANKTNYTFPSQKVANQTEDILYSNLYFGEELNIETADSLISKNIPMDPVKFDWNEFVKGEKKMMKFYSKREKFIRIATDWIFRIGFVVSVLALIFVTAPYNLIIFGLYIILALLRKFGLKTKALGSLTDTQGNPLSFAIIRVFSPDLSIEITNKVADKIGRYYCLVPKGQYSIRIEKKNDDESYTQVYESGVFSADSGIINRDIII